MMFCSIDQQLNGNKNLKTRLQYLNWRPNKYQEKKKHIRLRFLASYVTLIRIVESRKMLRNAVIKKTQLTDYFSEK